MAKESKIDYPLHTSTFWLARWPQKVGYLAALWSLIYGLLGLYWSLGGVGFPFGEGNPEAADMGSLLVGVRAAQVGPVIAVLGLFGSIVALAMVQSWGRKFPRFILLAFAWSMCVLLVMVVPDISVLQNMAYSLMLVFVKFTWPVQNLFFCIVGGMLWGMTALVYQRKTQNACEHCGRNGNSGAGWTTPGAAARWGKWVTYCAALMPLPYAISRWSWALGIPLGVNYEFLDPLINAGFIERFGLFMLGGLCVGGAILSLGLTQRWGEKFPRWIPGLSGRRVPPALAIIPASLVSIAVIVAGRAFYSWTLPGILTEGITSVGGTGWPALFFLPWGITLGLATLAYYFRRRGGCRHCGQS